MQTTARPSAALLHYRALAMPICPVTSADTATYPCGHDLSVAPHLRTWALTSHDPRRPTFLTHTLGRVRGAGNVRCSWDGGCMSWFGGGRLNGGMGRDWFLSGRQPGQGTQQQRGTEHERYVIARRQRKAFTAEEAHRQ